MPEVPAVRPNPRAVIVAANDPPVVVPKDAPLRSESYRRYVAQQECFCCRLEGYSQCAHENVGKGMSLKVCDSRTFPACAPHHGLIGCHQAFDLGLGYDRDTRRELGAEWVADMQARAVKDGWDMETLKRKT